MYLVRKVHQTLAATAQLHSVRKDWPMQKDTSVIHWSSIIDSKFTLQTHQNQWRIVVRISSIDIDTLGDLLLADFQIALAASIAEFAERLTEIQRVIVLDSALFDQLLLIVQADFQLILAQHCPLGHFQVRGAPCHSKWESNKAGPVTI